MLQCEVLTDSRQNVEYSSGHSDTELKELQCEVLTDSGQNAEYSSGHSDTEPKVLQCEVLTDSRQNVEYSSGHSYREMNLVPLDVDREWTDLQNFRAKFRNVQHTAEVCDLVQPKI